MNGYKLFRHDYERFSAGIMLYLNEEIPYKFLNNQLKRKWLLLGFYKPPTQSKF